MEEKQLRKEKKSVHCTSIWHSLWMNLECPEKENQKWLTDNQTSNMSAKKTTEADDKKEQSLTGVKVSLYTI